MKSIHLLNKNYEGFHNHSNTNGLGLRLNAIEDLCPLILHQLVVGWIDKAHSPTSGIRAWS